MDNIEKILNNLKFMHSTDKEFNKYSDFWLSLSKEEIDKISNVVLQKPGTKLTYLDKYSLDELNYIFLMFPIETINKKLKEEIDSMLQYKICSILEYRAYTTNIILIKNLNKYKKYRLKLKK